MKYKKLTNLIEKLKNDKYGEWSDQPNILPYVNYSKNVDNFVDIVYEIVEQNKDINFSDYLSECKKRKIFTEKEIKKKLNGDISCDDILLALLRIIRWDRFSEGTILYCFKSGLIIKLLEKLKEMDI